MPEQPGLDPITVGRRLAEARKAAGISQQQAARRLGCSRPTLIAIEKGTRAARPREVMDLAGFYGRNVHDIVRPGAPAVALAPHLRASLGKEVVDGDIQAAIGEMQGLADDYRQLEELADLPQRPANLPPPTGIPPNVALGDFAADSARRERQRLGLGDQPIANLFDVVENEVGLRVFYRPLPSHVAGLFAGVADVGFCVMINANHPSERQRFTLAHEYGHLLVDRFRPGIDYLGRQARRPRTERFADAFAACLLMPEAGVRRHFVDTVRQSGDFQVADVCRLSDRFHVSFQSMALRLEDLSLIPLGTWESLRDESFRVREANTALELPALPCESPHGLPGQYVALAIRTYRSGRISEGLLTKFLRTDRVTARRIVQEFEDRPGVGPGGDLGRLHVSVVASVLRSKPRAGRTARAGAVSV